MKIEVDLPDGVATMLERFYGRPQTPDDLKGFVCGAAFGALLSMDLDLARQFYAMNGGNDARIDSWLMDQAVKLRRNDLADDLFSSRPEEPRG